MTGGDAAVVGETPDRLGNLDTDSGISLEVSEFEEAWRELVLDIRERRYETDVEERHSNEYIQRAFELALANPESVSISTKPMERHEDMAEHIHGDIEALMGSADFRNALVTPAPDIDRILKLFELGYLYDSVHRFMPVTIVEPGIDGLEEIRFVELPADLHEWMGRVDTLWLALGGDISPDFRIEERIHSLYESRWEFVERAKDREIFLPVRSPGTDNPEHLRERISTGLHRNGRVEPELVHKYCFSRAAEY